MNSLKKFLTLIKYIFKKKISFLTLSSRLYRSITVCLTQVAQSDYLQIFSALSPRSFYDRTGLTRFRGLVIRALFRANVNVILLINQDAYTQLLRALSVLGFFTIGISPNTNSQKLISAVLPTNKNGVLYNVIFLRLLISTLSNARATRET